MLTWRLTNPLDSQPAGPDLEESHWLYFSGAEFEKGKAKYQQWLENERQEKRAEQVIPENQN